MSAKTVVGVLRDARALVEQGWVQNTYEQSGCYCAMGAIYKVTGDFRRSVRIVALLDDAVGQRVEPWQDTPGRTQAEVLAAFDNAIEAAEATS